MAPLLIAGATGTLGRAFVRAAQLRGLPAIAMTRAIMAIDDERSVEAAIARYRPWAVINATGWVRVDDAEYEEDACHQSNVTGAVTLATACENHGLPSIHFSSDLVFDGTSTTPYAEDALVNPLNIYGQSKADADFQLLQLSKALVIRSAAFFSFDDRHNFAFAVADSLRDGRVFRASDQHAVSPTYVPHLVDASLDLLIDQATGLWHLSNGEELSWFDFASRIAESCNLDSGLISAAGANALGWVAARPQRSGLVSKAGQLLPSLENAIADFADGDRHQARDRACAL